MNDDDLRKTVSEVQNELRRKQAQARMASAADNKKKGEASWLRTGRRKAS